jgi:hypothetical protein
VSKYMGIHNAWRRLIFTCHNIEPSLRIIINDGDPYFEKKIILNPKFIIVPHVEFSWMDEN